MKTIRTLAAVLLFITGVLHIISVLLAQLNRDTLIALVFGVAYLIIAAFLLRAGKAVLWFAAIVPLVGLLLAVVGMLANPTLLGAIFIAIDVVVSVCAFYLIGKGRQAILSAHN